jgi:hypothetical protein
MYCRFIVLSVVALAGCGSQPGQLTQLEFCNKYAQTVCAAVEPACLITEASCTAGRLAECSGQAQESVSAGRAFNPANAEAYLNKVNAAYGAKGGAFSIGKLEWQALTQARDNVYRGPIAANGVCAVDADCLDGLICDKQYCGKEKVVAQGAGCANIGETCPPGSYCSSATGVWMCVSKVVLGGSCAASPCLENLRCAGGICAQQLGFGELCSADQDCESGDSGSRGFCEPYAAKCALDVQFSNGSAACIAIGSN